MTYKKPPSKKLCIFRRNRPFGQILLCKKNTLELCISVLADLWDH